MKDFNFFSPYLREKRNIRLKRIYAFAVVSLVTIGLLSFIALNNYQINKYKSEISKVENYLNSEQTKELLKKYEETTRKKQLTDLYLKKVSEVDDNLRKRSSVSAELLSKLSSIMPKDASILSLLISNENIEVKYLVEDMVSVAEIEHNLRMLNIFDKLNVSVINAETSLTAIVSCRLKDVSDSEVKADE